MRRSAGGDLLRRKSDLSGFDLVSLYSNRSRGENYSLEKRRKLTPFSQMAGYNRNGDENESVLSG